jgi:hypothetical protein
MNDIEYIVTACFEEDWIESDNPFPLEFTTTSKDAATREAKRLCSLHPDRSVSISWTRDNDGQRGFLNLGGYPDCTKYDWNGISDPQRFEWDKLRSPFYVKHSAATMGWMIGPDATNNDARHFAQFLIGFEWELETKNGKIIARRNGRIMTKGERLEALSTAFGKKKATAFIQASTDTPPVQ